MPSKIVNKSIDVILLNYVLMFMEPREIRRLVGEIKRVARGGCRIMVEMYPAKKSHMPDKNSLTEGAERFKVMLGWKVISSQDCGCKFIAANFTGR